MPDRDVRVANDVIDAWPSKEFFIFMLTRDIELVDSIADLFDNCIDGARLARPKGKYDGLWVRIEASESRFRIADNCGGISIELAKQYAFRFGRPSGMPKTKHSVGQFGIGMKRAMFKMGSEFTVESATQHSRFSMRVDVEKWQKEKDWTFHFAKQEIGLNLPEEKRGTTITVTKLYEGIAAEFRLENYQNLVREKLEAKHPMALTAGMSVSFNKVPLQFTPTVLLQKAGTLKPGYFEKEYLKETGTPVTVKIWAGISESDPAVGGWYVYCNGRAVLAADKSRTTGWGEDEVVSIPRYHNQYARFRGFAMFDCDDASLLPWNTSKTDVALDSALYQTARQQMIYLMKPVIAFLNELKREEKGAEETGQSSLLDAIESAKSFDLSKVSTASSFVAPKAKKATITRTEGLISYYRPLDQIALVKKALKVKSMRDVGQKTFEYFFKAECK